MLVLTFTELTAFASKQSVCRLRIRAQKPTVVLAVRAEDADSAEGAHSDWHLSEDWALADNTPRFTRGDGEHKVTFWNALALSSPVLRQRTPEELRSRAADLVEQAVGREPKVLRCATRQPDGSWAGSVDGQYRHFAASEGRLASGARFVESHATGEIFEVDELTPGPPELTPAWSQAGGVVALAASRARSAFDPAALYLAAIAATGLLVGGQLLALGLHTATPAAVRAGWQQERVAAARNDVLELERWMEWRREAFEKDQDTFVRRLGELEPRLRASEARLAELKAFP